MLGNEIKLEAKAKLRNKVIFLWMMLLAHQPTVKVNGQFKYPADEKLE